MIRSMTAFARVQKQLATAHLCWEIRSVNHRYLDVSFRLPEALRCVEPQLRNALKGRIQRGKLECQLKIQPLNSANQPLQINTAMVDSLVDCSAQLAGQHFLANDLTVSKVLAWPGVLHEASCDSDDLAAQALSLFDEAIAQLSQFRGSEGTALKEHVATRLEQLNEQVLCAKALISPLAATAKDKLLTRLNSLAMEVAEGRIEQEIALLLARLDVTEELDRLQTHCVEVQKALNSGQSAGRRLDFLMQELNREANTLSSKSDSSELTQCAIEMKVLIEQMREQIQNIE